MINLEDEMLKLTLQLYNNPLISLKTVQFIVDRLINFINVIYVRYIEEKGSQLNKSTHELSNIIKAISEDSKQIFNKFSTEHLRFELYKEKGLLTFSKKCEIGRTFNNIVENNQVCITEKKIYAQYIPLKWSLKVMLEIPGIFDLLVSYMNELEKETNIISNFIQSDCWKKLKCSRDFENKFVIPLFMYQDDFETGNPLGSNAGKNKLGGVYVSIPCFPQYITSQLNYILLTILFYANDRKEYGNKSIFHPLIIELNELKHEGLVINVNNKQHKIFFQLCLILGDNLGLNEILGFTNKFSSGKPCRICSASIEYLINVLTRENEQLLRTPASYNKDCNKKNSSETGIEESCVFHTVNGFHVCDNICLDIMHDIFEGTANYTMVNICRDLIYKQKLFSLEFLNDRTQAFKYGSVENSTKIPVIKKEHFKSRNKFKMSAAEMIAFTKYFGLLVGDKVQEDNSVWDLYIMFRKIVAIVTSPRIVQGHIIQLEVLIPEFLYLYKELYGSLKYKFHNMTHIVRCLMKNGPLVYYWTMRYESKHRQLKFSAVATNNRVNLIKTISNRSQLQLAYLRYCNDQQYNRLIINSSEDIDAYTRKLYFPNSADGERILSTIFIEFKGLEYRINMVVVVEINDNMLSFGKILNIFIKDENIYVLLQRLNNICFNEHYYAYNVEICRTYFLKNINALPDIHPCILIEGENSTYFVATKYIL